MPSLIPYDEFLGQFYKDAWSIAEKTIASVVKKNGPINPAIDIESVKAAGALAGLERTYQNFDIHHESGATERVLLNTVVKNCVLTELGKATTATKRAQLAPGKSGKAKNENARKYHNLIPGIKPRKSADGAVEAHVYMETDDWVERKEKVFKRIGIMMKKLPAYDQIILMFWANDEHTYVERSLEELGLEHTPTTANWVYGRKNKALKALRKMMGGEKPDYHDIYLPSAGANVNSIVYSDRNELRRHQYAAKNKATEDINYEETAVLLTKKL